MYFKEPKQLLEVFALLEERNLFLIQNSQETEEAFDELKQSYEATKIEMLSLFPIAFLTRGRTKNKKGR